MNIIVLSALVITFTLSGCASITGTTGQSISIMTKEQNGKEISGVACDLSNKRGSWFLTTPGSVAIHRSNDDLQVTCKKDGLEPGRVAVISETKGSMFGNILFGGGIGAIVDHSNGSAYEYPNLVQVVMGVFTKVDSPKTEQIENNKPMAGSVPPQIKTASTVSDVTQQLKDLKQLHEQGLISEDVYINRQKQLLENVSSKRIQQKTDNFSQSSDNQY
jgi:hypothetical protein